MATYFDQPIEPAYGNPGYFVAKATGAVGEACVFGAQDLDWGERVEAAVTAPEGGHVDIDALRAAVRDRLGPVKTPKRIHVLDALPRNGLGKLMRTDLVRQFSETS